MLNLKIVQWNIRSINSNRENLNNLICREKPHIILLNETWLKPNQNFCLKSFHIVRQDRDDGYAGVATCIRKNIVFNTIRKFLSDYVQYIIIQVGDILIKNIYVSREHAVDENLLKSLYDHDELQKSILMGDMNSHHPIWDKMSPNKGGRIISDFILGKELVVMNSGSPTLFSNPSQNVSAVDLSIVSLQLATKSNWSIIQDSGNSDHYPTCLEINFKNDTRLNRSLIIPYEVRNFSKANWEEYQDKTLLNIIHINKELNYDDLIEVMNIAAEETIPYKKCGIFQTAGNLWWDKECSELIQRRKNALKHFNNFPSLENYIAAKREIALVRKSLRSKKRESFITFCGTLNRESNIKYIWNKIMKFSNNKKKYFSYDR